MESPISLTRGSLVNIVGQRNTEPRRAHYGAAHSPCLRYGFGMLSILTKSRQFGRHWMERPSGSPLRHAIMEIESRRETSFVARRAKDAGLEVANWNRLSSSLESKGDAETFFVLGSGASIEELSDNNFAEIAKNRSVGINNWGLHPFVPDFFCFESAPNVGDGGDLGRAVQFLDREDIVARQPPILLLRPRTQSEMAFFDLVPASLRHGIFLYGRVSPATRNLGNLRSDVSFYFRHIGCRRAGILLDSGASALRMAVLGFLMGYKNISFAGVDLTSSQYFWEKNPCYLDTITSPPPSNNQQSDSHETMSAETRPFGVLEMIRALAGYVEDVSGGRVAVTSSSSALASFLPLHPWSAS